jgi:hypothetical protein
MRLPETDGCADRSPHHNPRPRSEIRARTSISRSRPEGPNTGHRVSMTFAERHSRLCNLKGRARFPLASAASNALAVSSRAPAPWLACFSKMRSSRCFSGGGAAGGASRKRPAAPRWEDKHPARRHAVRPRRARPRGQGHSQGGQTGAPPSLGRRHRPAADAALPARHWRPRVGGAGSPRRCWRGRSRRAAMASRVIMRRD